MNAHERQQFEVLLQGAVERFAERLMQRNDGPDNARVLLAERPDSEGVWLSRFVDAVFQDNLIDNVAGACFVLEALERRPVPAPASGETSGATIGAAVSALAHAAFGLLLRQKTLEELDRRASYQAVDTTGA